MNKLYVTLLFILFVIPSRSFAQEQIHRWKPVVVNEDKKVWYDAASVDSVSQYQFNIWILQMHRPPLVFEGIRGEVYRSKTLYALDLKTAKYGIMQVVYYDLSNKEIFNFDYAPSLVNDEVKYTYPVTEGSFIFSVIKDLFKTNGK